jgi:hypothetical protein
MAHFDLAIISRPPSSAQMSKWNQLHRVHVMLLAALCGSFGIVAAAALFISAMF